MLFLSEMFFQDIEISIFVQLKLLQIQMDFKLKILNYLHLTIKYLQIVDNKLFQYIHI